MKLNHRTSKFSEFHCGGQKSQWKSTFLTVVRCAPETQSKVFRSFNAFSRVQPATDLSGPRYLLSREVIRVNGVNSAVSPSLRWNFGSILCTHLYAQWEGARAKCFFEKSQSFTPWLLEITCLVLTFYSPKIKVLPARKNKSFWVSWPKNCFYRVTSRAIGLAALNRMTKQGRFWTWERDSCKT